MSRTLPVGLLAGLTAWALAPAPLGAGETAEVHVIAAAHDSPLEAGIGPIRLKDEGGVVIRSARELVARSDRPDAAKDADVQKAVEAELAKVLGVSAIDWDRQMVLAVRGTAGTRLDRVHIDSLKVEGKVLTVAFKVKQRPPHAGPGSPLAVLLVDRFDHEVRFVDLGQR